MRALIHIHEEKMAAAEVLIASSPLSLPLSQLLLSLLLSNVNPSCHPWVQPLSSLKRATSIPHTSIGGRRYCFRIFMLGLVGIVLKDKRERNFDIYILVRDREFPTTTLTWPIPRLIWMDKQIDIFLIYTFVARSRI